MRTYDFSPLWRSTIGFDRLFDLAESAQRASEDNYPPYNIERLGEDRYQISLAVAGFSPDEISVTAEQNVVTIEGGKAGKARARVSLSRHLDPRLQAAVQPGRLCPGQERVLRQRLAQDRTGPGDPRGHEAAADRHQRRDTGQPAPARSQGGLSDTPAAARPLCRAAAPPVFEWRKPCGRRPRQRQRLRFSSAPASRHRLRASQGRGDASVPDAGREAGDPRLLGFRRFGDCLLPGPAGSGRTEDARQHRRHPGSLVRAGRRPSTPAGRQAEAPLLRIASAGGLRRMPWKISAYPDT